MSLSTLNYFDYFDDFMDDMNHFFTPLISIPHHNRKKIPTRRMDLDMKETEKSYEISAELPGLIKDNIKLSVEKGKLHIYAERSGISTNKDGDKYHYTERQTGSVSRWIKLPDTADPDSVKAKYENGVLYVSIVKNSEQQRRTITIE